MGSLGSSTTLEKMPLPEMCTASNKGAASPMPSAWEEPEFPTTSEFVGAPDETVTGVVPSAVFWSTNCAPSVLVPTCQSMAPASVSSKKRRGVGSAMVRSAFGTRAPVV